MVSPGSGQDATQQGKDESECYTWARQQTGIDPTVAPTPAPVADAPQGGAVKGAAPGAPERGGGGRGGGGGQGTAGAEEGRQAGRGAGAADRPDPGRRPEGHVQEGLGR